LAAARRRDVGFARANSDVVIDDPADRVQRNSRAIVLDYEARRLIVLAGRNGDLDDRRDRRVFTGVDAVVDQL
jgi:hypothetical protein